MHTYYIDKDNLLRVRTRLLNGSEIDIKMTDMYRFVQREVTVGTGSYTYDERENYMELALPIMTGSEGDQYRVQLLMSGSVIWNGTIQLLNDYMSRKDEYINRIPEEETIIGDEGDGYIIMT